MKTMTVVADKEKTNFYSGSGLSSPLEFRFEMINQRARDLEQDYNADRPGRGTDRGGQGVHTKSFSSSSKDHQLENYCALVAKRIDEASIKGDFERLILVAGPKVLGLLRKHLSDQSRKSIVDELAEDIGHLPVSEINERLKNKVRL